MGILEFPNPLGWYESAKNSGLERQEANALVSAMYSAWLTAVWTAGAKNWWGLGQALRDAATASYITLSNLEAKGFLTITVPKELLEDGNLSRFQTEAKTK